MNAIAVPAAIRDYIADPRFIGGELRAHRSTVDEDLLVVTGIEGLPGSIIHPRRPAGSRALANLTGGEVHGQWLGPVPRGTHVLHYDLRHRPGTGCSFKDFNDAVPNVRDPRGQTLLLITHEPDLPTEWLEAGVTEFAGWHVTNDAATPVDLVIQPAAHGIETLDPQWPAATLLTKRIGVVGIGSIGGAATDALAAYGVGHLDLIDPDRFWWHNDVRHVLGLEAVGQLKVETMREQLQRRWPATEVAAHPDNVVTSAHTMRTLFTRYDAIVCAADGIAARRVVSHLARRAGIPAVLACVLDDGGVGEVLRLRPAPKYGCLLCHRAELVKNGGIDVEAQLERDYGHGDTHRPMTAVGPDLWLIGHLAAKTAVDTILESQHGELSHRLPGDHAVVGLRPSADKPAAPYDLTNAQQVQWNQIPEPRPGCPTCSAA